MAEAGRILIADDEPDFLRATAGFLHLRGYQCDCVQDANAALEKLHSTEYDLLISDIEMPGNEKLALIRSVPQIISGLPIILVTGHPSVQTAIESFQFTVVAYLVKPLKPEDLTESVGRAIERYRAYRAVRHSHRRLQESCRELERLESLLRAEPGGATTRLWSVFPGMVLQQIADSLQDLERYTEALIQQKTGDDSPSPAALQLAVRETIAVLEKTKNAFKSKDLGELRRRLETLMEQNAGKN